MDGSALYSDVCEIGIHGPQLAGKATAEALRHGGPSFNQSDYNDRFEVLVSGALSCRWERLIGKGWTLMLPATVL